MTTLAPTPAPRMLELRAAAERLNVSDKSVRRWIASGRLKAYRVGPRLIRVDAASVEALMQPIGSTELHDAPTAR